MTEMGALKEVERLARASVDCQGRDKDKLVELRERAQDLDNDSIHDLCQFVEDCCAIDVADDSRELRLALVQLDLARAKESERLNDPMFAVETK